MFGYSAIILYPMYILVSKEYINLYSLTDKEKGTYIGYPINIY